MAEDNVLYIVHCIDTEGPLDESVAATFERLYTLFGLSGLEPTSENLELLRRGVAGLGPRDAEIADFLNSFMMSYKRNWEQLDEMLYRIMDSGYRNLLPDSNGGGWVYNWFCMDHVGYQHNPRKRDLGFHHIFDHYRNLLQKTGSHQDGLHWHFHSMSFDRAAHHRANSYIYSPHLHEILCRRILERNWFPVANRPGYNIIRPDSHFFLEQWIPFDFANQSIPQPEAGEAVDLMAGRLGDWRMAPDDWSIYQPDHDNYQVQGNCRRYLARCLNMKNRFAELSLPEVEKAFARAATGRPTLLAFTNHDFREMTVEIDRVRDLIRRASASYPQVRFQYTEAREAMRSVIFGAEADQAEALRLELTVERHGHYGLIRARAVAGATFGPQPYLAMQTKDGRFFTDNFNHDQYGWSWFYVLDEHSFAIDDLLAVAVASNDKYGNTSIALERIS